HHAEHADEDDDADPENVGVQADDLLGHRTHRRLEIPLVIRERNTRCGGRQSNGGSKERRYDGASSGAILHAIPDRILLAFSLVSLSGRVPADQSLKLARNGAAVAVRQRITKLPFLGSAAQQ